MNASWQYLPESSQVLMNIYSNQQDFFTAIHWNIEEIIYNSPHGVTLMVATCFQQVPLRFPGGRTWPVLLISSPRLARQWSTVNDNQVRLFYDKDPEVESQESPLVIPNKWRAWWGDFVRDASLILIARALPAVPSVAFEETLKNTCTVHQSFRQKKVYLIISWEFSSCKP